MTDDTKKIILAIIVVLLVVCCIRLRMHTGCNGAEHALNSVKDVEKRLLNDKILRLKKDLRYNITAKAQKENELYNANTWNRKKISDELDIINFNRQFIIDEMSIAKNKLLNL